MIEMTYRDAYDIERHQTFDDPNDFIRVLMGCVTLPDYYPVTRISYKGKDAGFQGKFGDLFATFINFDWSPFD